MLAMDWNVERFNYRPYVGFADMLGYRSLVFDETTSNSDKLGYLCSVYAAMGHAVQQVMTELRVPDLVKVIQFSDCFYFKSDCPVSIIVAMAEFFSQTSAIYSQVYEATNEWQPFLRGAIARDWIMEGLDITLPTTQGAFRNPMGPAVAKAYVLAEESGIQGMRLALFSEVAQDFEEARTRLDPRSI